MMVEYEIINNILSKVMSRNSNIVLYSTYTIKEQGIWIWEYTKAVRETVIFEIKDILVNKAPRATIVSLE